MDMLKELMKKKGKGKMDENYKNAKMCVLDEIKKLAEDAMSEDVKGLQKVTVAAPDKEGLKKGLDKAEEVLEMAPEMMGEEGEEESTEEGSEGLTEEEQALLAKLMSKAKMKM